MCRFFDDIPRTAIENLIHEWIHDERDRDLVHRRILDGITYEKLADEFCLSVTQVKSICYKAQRKMIEHI